MAVTVQELDTDENGSVILEKIFEITSAEPRLTPRSLEKLKRLARDKNVLVAYVDGQLSGWAIREPLGGKVYELGLFYVMPQFRSEDVFSHLCPALLSRSGTYIFATYNARLMNLAKQKFGFRETKLVELALKSRGRFITKRLDAESRRSVKEKMRDEKPILAIREAQ